MIKKFQSITGNVFPTLLTIAVIIAVWMSVTGMELVPAFMLPSPGAVLSAFVKNFGYMAKESVYTLQEAVYGLLSGIVLAFILGDLVLNAVDLK